MDELPSNTQLDRLGRRLAAAAAPSAEDFRLLQRFRAAHASALAYVEDGLEELGYRATSRTKTPATIIDKLRRESTRLTSIQDIAGARIVVDVTLDGQDAVVQAVLRRFTGAVHDRRERPSHGYRAVHVVVRIDGRRVEIQVRTPLQHLWAEVMERAGDRFGRGIRYGELPQERSRREVVEGLVALSAELAEHERLRSDVARSKRELDAEEISFRRALRVILDALEGGEGS